MSNLWNSLLADKLPCGHSFSQHIQRQAGIDIGPCIEKPKIRLMCDSGAFSSYTLGKPVSVTEYSDFVLKNERYIDESICLDVIAPGNPEKAAEAGMKNFLYMKDRGINCLPVYHARESTKWVDKMLKLTDRIGLSGTSLVSPRENLIWHNMVFDYLTDKEGYPIGKFHSFGDVSTQRMITYPFFSSDSSTYMVAAGRAACVRLNGKPYQLKSHSIRNSSYISLDDTGPKKKAWERECAALGVYPDKVLSFEGTKSQVAMIRSYLVAADILRLQERTRNLNKYKKPASLFSKKENVKGFVREGPINFFYVLSPSAYCMNFPVLAALNIKNILVSYFYINTASKNFWQEKMVPYLYDPIGFCQSDKKLKIFWDKLCEILVKEPVSV